MPFLKFRSSSIVPYTFRHAFAINSHLNGVDVYQIMKSLGHEQLSTTEIYLEKDLKKNSMRFICRNQMCLANI
ncbi:tyrosine-type recombinase/integrase [Peribacillus sp. NPDC094092]|uniref:tyrosine-type recombinase/integrase n=1 Tax=Peribacillus sp. NPDC094092 TaxID=3390611 RepID=UPI003CFC0FB0